MVKAPVQYSRRRGASIGRAMPEFEIGVLAYRQRAQGTYSQSHRHANNQRGYQTKVQGLLDKTAYPNTAEDGTQGHNALAAQSTEGTIASITS